MIHVKQGNITTAVFSEKEGLTNWNIKLTGKSGRTSSSQDIPMVETNKSDRRYYLDWIVPALTKVEYDYEISADGVLIDKGILRYGMV